MNFLLVFLVFLSSSLFSVQQPGTPFCYFRPPAGWRPAPPQTPSSSTEVGFITKGKTSFHPSIHLAKEEVDVSLKEYVKAVKELHAAQPDTQIRDLGPFKMQAGLGHLLELSCPSAWGRIQMLQALYVQENMAYILTAALLQEEFSQHQREILSSLRSLTLAADLFSSLPRESERNQLREDFSSLTPSEISPKEKWEKFQKVIEKDYAQMGAYWQFFALKEGHAKIFSSQKEEVKQ